MQSLWCCKQILTKSVAQIHVYLYKGTLALREGTKVHINVLPLGVLLVCQFLEVGKEISWKISVSIRLKHTGVFGCKFTKKSLNVYNTKKALNSTKEAFCIVQNVHRVSHSP